MFILIFRGFKKMFHVKLTRQVLYLLTLLQNLKIK